MKSLGNLWLWGNNAYGALGDNTTVSKSSPIQIGTDTTWMSISYQSWSQTTLGIKQNGTLWVWGKNTNGVLGQGDTIDRSSPVQVGILTTWKQASLGVLNTPTYNVLAVKTNGTLWGWGLNAYGELGDNTTVAKSSPVQIGSLTTWSAVCADYNTTAAVKSDGTLWSWGANNYGQIGDSTTVNKSSPIQIGNLTTWSPLLTPIAGFAAIKTDGTLWGWGDNDYGQYGLGDTVARSSPVQIGSLTTWKTIATHRHALGGVTSDGKLWIIGGDNAVGELGDGSNVWKSSPVQIGTLTTWSKVGFSAYKSGYAVKTDGTLWTWGGNDNGEIGDGTTVAKSSPVQVGTSTFWCGLNAIQYPLSLFSRASHPKNAKGFTFNQINQPPNYFPDANEGDTWYNPSIPEVKILNNYQWKYFDQVTTTGYDIKLPGGLWVWGANAYGQLVMVAGGL